MKFVFTQNIYLQKGSNPLSVLKLGRALESAKRPRIKSNIFLFIEQELKKRMIQQMLGRPVIIFIRNGPAASKLLLEDCLHFA